MKPNEETKRQHDIAQRLKTKWLERMEAMLDANTITSTDMATLYRFFSDNGWTVDPSKLSPDLQSMLGELPPDFDKDPIAGSIGALDTGTG